MRFSLPEWPPAGFRVEKREEEEEEEETGMISTPEYMCFCVLPMENSVCAAVLFLSRSSNVLSIGSANPQIFFPLILNTATT